MDYFNRVQRAVDYIEQNLDKEIGITDIASKAFFSPFHFQRLFQAISGFSVQAYIRKRRMSEAAVLLKKTDKTILEIAVISQYGSQEAFTRAFHGCFGITPSSYRKLDKCNIQYLKKMNFMNYKNHIHGDLFVEKPEIIQLGKKNIVGYTYKTNLNDEKYFDEIPRFYEDFGRNEYYKKIPERLAPAFSYGISCDYLDDGQFSFVVGESVRQPIDERGSVLVNKEIPEGKYAQFKVNSSVEVTQNTWRYIYGAWLPNSNYERREGPDFEITDVCKSEYPHNMVTKILIPIK
ncbi:AraC family transcriptional regulator [Bacillus alkalicellulosilyticus]|uniref:AraC family transcriptional regulator n=1 Tax=Alkalihalobacterium alkalicellulosilyticum TaxID=1912214 RepID=UPI000996853A|nr:effector binding domain-containing protein [Bacillus alkalicellulosilyticus]